MQPFSKLASAPVNTTTTSASNAMPTTSGNVKKNKNITDHIFFDPKLLGHPGAKDLIGQMHVIESLEDVETVNDKGEKVTSKQTVKTTWKLYYPGLPMPGGDINTMSANGKLCVENVFLFVKPEMTAEIINMDLDACLKEDMWCYALWVGASKFVKPSKSVLANLTPKASITKLKGDKNRKLTADGRIVPALPPHDYNKRMETSNKHAMEVDVAVTPRDGDHAKVQISQPGVPDTAGPSSKKKRHNEHGA